METFFLICFIFGALFTTLTAAFAFVGAGHLSHGHELPTGHGHGPAHLPHGAHGADASISGHANGHLASDLEQAAGGRPALPLANASSVLAFLTWFGAAGYLLMHFAGWSALLALPVALAPGFVAALLIAFFLGKVLAGEREMIPSDYRLEGTLARVTVSIPANGVGEVVFSKAGTRRSEAARSLSGQAIPRGAEVAILDYERGVALVQTWNQLLGRAESTEDVPS